MLFDDGVEELVKIKSSINKGKAKDEELNQLNPYN